MNLRSCKVNEWPAPDGQADAQSARVRPHQLVTLWDMIQFQAHVLSQLLMEMMELERQIDNTMMRPLVAPQQPALAGQASTNTSRNQQAGNTSQSSPVRYQNPAFGYTSEHHAAYCAFFMRIKDRCDQLNLDVCLVKLNKIIQSHCTRAYTYWQLREDLKVLRERINDEVSSRLFMFIPPERAKYYQNQMLFGQKVEERFPRAADDIAEAGKCFAAGRWTGVVFHLMRVMEIGVQEFAAKLRVSLPSDKMWGQMLNEIDQTITGMPRRTAKQREKATPLEEAAVYLHHVKNVWRNPTMHPKESYTEEEAERVFSNVKHYMQHLVTIL